MKKNDEENEVPLYKVESANGEWVNIVDAPFYWGKIDREEMEEILKKFFKENKTPCYVFRYSERSSSNVALTLINGNKELIHYLITKTGKKLAIESKTLDENSYDTWRELLASPIFEGLIPLPKDPDDPKNYVKYVPEANNQYSAMDPVQYSGFDALAKDKKAPPKPKPKPKPPKKNG